MEQETTINSNSSTWTTGIGAITLFVEDLEASRQFYLKTFSLPVVYEDEDCTVFKFENTLVNLLKASAGVELLEPAVVASREAGSRFVFTINVDNVNEICRELAARGVTLLNGPMDRPWGIRTASFVDPGGYVWEIASPL
jgi:lactoylglutathione lyase